MTNLTEQLILNGMRLRDDATFSNFFVGNNTQIVTLLQNLSQSEWFTYLWGKPSSGRTHLLHAVCLAAQEQKRSAIYLPMQEIIHLSAAMLEDLEQADIICIDDIDLIAGKKEWELAFFHLYNRAQLSQTHLIITANVPPRELALMLPDLKSRLTAGIIFQLHILAEDERLAALKLRAKNRGLVMSDEVGLFILRRSPRDLSSIFNVLDKLDHASLTAHRRLTIPFVKDVLQH